MAKKTGNKTATGVAALSGPATVYYYKKFIENLKTNTAWGRAVCGCGADGIHKVWYYKNGSGNEIYLCDGCKFRHTVMKAAGRESEFIEDYESKKSYQGGNFTERRPLPEKSGKTIQMFQYGLVTKK